MSIPRRSATVVVRWEHPLPNDFIHPEPRLWFRFKPRKIVLPITSIGRRGDLDFGWRILDYASEHSHFTLVLLFCVPPGQVCQAGGPRPDVCDDRSRVLFEWFEHNFFRITQFLEADLMVCNAGSIDPECVPLDPESDRRTVQNAVEAKVRKDCPSPESLGNFTPEQIKKIPGRIRFVSMEEYLEENDWEGELKEAEVRPWLDLMAAEKAGLASGAIGHRGQASKVGEGSRVEEI